MKNLETTEEQNKEQSFHVADITCNAVFKLVPTSHLTVTGLYIGKVRVASYCRDGTSNRLDPKKYVVNSVLPTIINPVGRFETEKECRDACIKVAQVFCQQLRYGSKPIENKPATETKMITVKFKTLNVGDAFECYGDTFLNYTYAKICKCIKIDFNKAEEIDGVSFYVDSLDDVFVADNEN